MLVVVLLVLVLLVLLVAYLLLLPPPPLPLVLVLLLLALVLLALLVAFLLLPPVSLLPLLLVVLVLVLLLVLAFLAIMLVQDAPPDIPEGEQRRADVRRQRHADTGSQEDLSVVTKVLKTVGEGLPMPLHEAGGLTKGRGRWDPNRGEATAAGAHVHLGDPSIRAECFKEDGRWTDVSKELAGGRRVLCARDYGVCFPRGEV